MTRGLLGILTGLALLASGCSALINPDDDRLNVGPRRDAGTVVTLRDSGPPVGTDAGVPGTCTGTAARCAGDTLVRCVDGMEVFESCPDRGAFCQSRACQPWVCVPGTRRCNEPQTESLLCSERGHRESGSSCGSGRCNPATGLCEDTLPDSCSGLAAIGPGSTRTIDLCELDDRNDPVTAGFPDCPGGDVSANGGDAVFRLVIEAPGTYEIQLTDVDDGAAIDTVVYLRSTCDRPDSQLACADDTDCLLPGFPDDSCRSPSRITRTFEPGVYYVVVDAYRYMGSMVEFRCGVVQLVVRPAVTTTP